MANLFVRSTDGNNADNGTTWALAKATLAGAFAVATAGDTIFVSDNHAEASATGITLTSPGTAANQVRVLCVDDAGDPASPTTLATTATLTNSSGSNNPIVFAGFAYCYGLSFINAHSGSTADIRFDSVEPWWWCLERCKLRITGTVAGQQVECGSSNQSSTDDQLLELVDTTIEFAASGQTIVSRARMIWQCTTSAIAGTAPSVLFTTVASDQGDFIARGVDFSAVTGTLIDPSAAAGGSFTLENCRLGPGVTIASPAPAGQGGFTVRVVNCDSADTNYRYYRRIYQGEIFHEPTIVRTGGASDGTKPISRKMMSSPNSKIFSPLVSDPISIWNETIGSITATVEVVTDNITLTDADAWIEVEYLGTAGVPLSLFANDRMASVLATPANQTSSSVDWTTTGLTTPVKQKLSVSFTPQEKGVVYIRVCLARASTTMYFCPKVDIS